MSLLALSAVAATCLAPTDSTGARDQYDAYAIRSLEIVSTASSNMDAALNDLIAEDAIFSVGAGDVGVPLGEGVAGAVALAERLNAADFEYPGWDYMNHPQDGCGEISVEIRFVETSGDAFTDMTFTYLNGLLTKASGWTRSRNAGKLSEVAQ